MERIWDAALLKSLRKISHTASEFCLLVGTSLWYGTRYRTQRTPYSFHTLYEFSRERQYFTRVHTTTSTNFPGTTANPAYRPYLAGYCNFVTVRTGTHSRPYPLIWHYQDFRANSFCCRILRLNFLIRVLHEKGDPFSKGTSCTSPRSIRVQP